MATVNYKGITELSPAATSSGGQLIINNDKELADRVGPVAEVAGDPTANDDGANTGGNGTFYKWSKWRNTGDNGVFVCLDNSTGAAVWVEVTAGGGGISNVVEDTTPQLGGNLDVNGNSIVSTANGDINITPNGSGAVVIDGISHPQVDGNAGDVSTTDGAGNLSFTPNYAIVGSRVLSGGVTYSGTGLGMNVSNIVAIIDGQYVTGSATDITLSTADGSNDRIDAIVINSSGTISKIDGTAAAVPVGPTIDESTYALIAEIRVNTSQTTPEITQTLIYSENAGTPTEWAAAGSDASIVANSTNDPYAGTTSVEGTAASNGDYIDFTAASAVDLTNIEYLSFRVKLKSAWNNQSRLQIAFYDASGRIGKVINAHQYGMDRSNTADHQLVNIDKSVFSLSSQSVTKVRFSIESNTTVGFYLDVIKLEEGATTSDPVPAYSNVSTDAGTIGATSERDTFSIVGGRYIATSGNAGVVTIKADESYTSATHSSGTLTLDASLAGKYTSIFDQAVTVDITGLPEDGAKLQLRVFQDNLGSGTYTSGSNIQELSETTSPALTASSGAVAYFGYEYNLSKAKWMLMAFNKE